MAGLDPAAEGTRQLVEQLLARKNARTGRIDFDSFMKTVIHFQVRRRRRATLDC